MDSAEHDVLIGELELRIDRLRSLYEQYFMGIERLEPSVPRKDVERRVQILRKEQIRNSGMRFRFQMLLQKYNTYQTYWQRICREMEAGTYKRHVIRARARFAREAETALERDQKAAKAGAGLGTSGRAPAPPLSAHELEKLQTLDDFDLEETPSGSVDVEFGALDDPFRRPQSSTSLLAAKPIHSPLPPSSTPSARGPASHPASAPRVPVSTSQAPAGRVWRKASPEAPRHSEGPGAPSDGAMVAAPPIATPPPPARPAPPRPAVIPGAPSSSILRAAPPAPAAPRAAGIALGARAPSPAPGPAPRSNVPDAADLSDARVRQLYAQLVETKRKQNESTAAITYDGVAKSLRESSAKLREKLGKSVDFEVTVKDGKTVIKPVVK